ncbi:CDP-diacylglycerol--serine O-phosphatidyltransferase 1-like [Hordeum vulgare subsp. vulgare]|uniref:CDP-diacylglycerol--serine O-phosphatidyltransferase 1-like n=1 Tax=Hordeum vulgare subsp. vulgare TaxID=112509 RepID=UPI001D1A5080|nr:CDP-diacylglycerol--serine O-phosphatidyltransferase 1-like [Hordeum vulgare subsp. vulgare]
MASSLSELGFDTGGASSGFFRPVADGCPVTPTSSAIPHSRLTKISAIGAGNMGMAIAQTILTHPLRKSAARSQQLASAINQRADQGFPDRWRRRRQADRHPLPPSGPSFSQVRVLPPLAACPVSCPGQSPSCLVKRTLGHFTPPQWDKDEWYPLLGPWRFIQVLSLCVIFMTIELNTFFHKFYLWIPPQNPLIVYRLVLWWLIAIPTIREYNTYLQDRKPVKKVGSFCWLSLAICIIELLICIKVGHGFFPKSMPSWLIVFWTMVAPLLTTFL